MAGNRSKQQRSSGPLPQARLFKPKQKTNFRSAVLAICAAYFAQKTFRPLLLPWGPAVSVLPIKWANIDFGNDLLQVKHGKTQKIYADDKNKMKGPETIVFGNDGTLYILTEDAFLVQLTDMQTSKENGVIVNATATVVRDLGPGRPLGGKFVPTSAATQSKNKQQQQQQRNTLYIADTLLGLTRIQNVLDPKSKLEIVVRSVTDDEEGIASPLRYTNDVAIGPKTGRVFFTDSTQIAPDQDHRTPRKWDTLYASKMDLMRGKPTGRLLQYDPATDETTILARNLHFANGVAVDKDETYVLVAETFGIHLHRYNLKDATLTTVVSSAQLPGYLDGVDCSWDTTAHTKKNSGGGNKCYAVMISAIVPLHKLLNALPGPLSQFLRNVVMMLPRFLAPPVQKFGGVVELDPARPEQPPRLFLDPVGKDISGMTGVTVHQGKLYLGSLKNDYVGVYEVV